MLESLIKRFDAGHPEIQVVVTAFPASTDLSIKIRAGERPDVMIAAPSEVAQYAAVGAVVPLDDYLKDSEIGWTTEDWNDVYPGFIDRYPQFGNRVCSLGWMRSMQVMYYNLTMLQAAGFYRPPQTWDEFARICAAVTKPPDAFCYQMQADASDFAMWVTSRGGSLLSPDGRTAAFAKPGLEALTLLNDLFRKKQAVAATRVFQEPLDFAAGKIAFTFDSTLGLRLYDQAVQSAGKKIAWGIAPSPRTTREPVATVFGQSLAVFQSTPERQRAAFRFIDWLLEPAPNAEWVSATGFMPARQSTRESLGDFLRANPQHRIALDWLAYSQSEPSVAAWAPIRTYLAETLTLVASGKATPEDAVQDAVRRADQALGK